MLALAPSYQFRADTVTLSVGNVATIPNRRGSDALVLAAGTLAAPAADAAFGGAQSIVFSGTQWLDSNLAASAWKFLHDGTGCEMFIVLAATTSATDKCVHATHDVTLGSTTAGIYQALGQSPSLQDTIIANGTASPANGRTVSNTGSTFAPLNTAQYSSYSLGTSQPFVYQKFSGATNYAAVASYTGGGPSSGNPGGTLRLGADLAGSARAFVGKWCETLIFPRVLHEYERQIVREYLQARYGIAAPSLTGADRDIMSLLPFSWLDAAAYNQSGGLVTAFLDRARPGHTYTQGTTGLQVSVPATDATLNGALSATFAGGQRYASTLAAAAWKFLMDGSGCEAALFMVPTNFAAAQAYLSTYTAPGSSALQVYTNVSSTVNLYIQNASNVDFAGRTRSLAAAAAQALSFRHGTAQSPQMTFRLNGAEQTNAYLATPSAGNPSAPLNIGGNPAGVAQYMSARLAAVPVFNRVLTTTERSKLIAAFSTKYGVAA